MTVFIGIQDRTFTAGTKLTTLNATAVYTNPATAKQSTKGVRLFVCNTDSSARTATVQWYDASLTTAYAIYDLFSIAAQTTLSVDLDGLQFDIGDELRVTAGTVDTLEVVVTTTEAVTRGS